jgi:hypothetical protein
MSFQPEPEYARKSFQDENWRFFGLCDIINFSHGNCALLNLFIGDWIPGVQVGVMPLNVTWPSTAVRTPRHMACQLTFAVTVTVTVFQVRGAGL